MNRYILNLVMSMNSKRRSLRAFDKYKIMTAVTVFYNAVVAIDKGN